MRHVSPDANNSTESSRSHSEKFWVPAGVTAAHAHAASHTTGRGLFETVADCFKKHIAVEVSQLSQGSDRPRPHSQLYHIHGIQMQAHTGGAPRRGSVALVMAGERLLPYASGCGCLRKARGTATFAAPHPKTHTDGIRTLRLLTHLVHP